MHDFIEQIGGSLTVAGVLVLFGRAYIAKTLRELDECVEGLNGIRIELATISAQLKNFERVQDLTYNLDRRVISIESHISKANKKMSGIDRQH